LAGLGRGPRPEDGGSETPNAAAFISRVLRLRSGSTALILPGVSSALVPALGEITARVVCSTLVPVRHYGDGFGTCDSVAASGAQLPFVRNSFDGIAELSASQALSVESNAESVTLLAELARVLRPGGRYLCGGGPALPGLGSTVSPDKRRLDEWKHEAGGVWHHSVRLVRPDGSWRRFHERLRARSFEDVEQLLRRAGFVVLNAFDGLSQQTQTQAPSGDAILLCERS